MWTLRILKGPQPGATFPLSSGLNSIGRANTCTVQIQAAGISRVHAEIEIQEGDIAIIDKNSSNGTYVNGVKVSRQLLEPGDQVAVHHVIFDVIRSAIPQTASPSPNVEGALALDMPPSAEPYPSTSPPPQEKPQGLNKIQQYLEKVLLPGVYKLPEWIDFKWVFGLFAIGFIFLATVFSAIPLVQILKTTVEKESKDHAESIALSLAEENKSALIQGLSASLSVSNALRRPGVEKALIINASDGRVLAPVEKINTYPKSSFIHRARKTGQKWIEKIDSSTVSAMIPIQYFNPDTSSSAVMAYSIIFYRMKTLSANNQQTISLIVQSFFIAVLLGLIIFFFMYKMVLHPFESMNEQMNTALRDNSSTITTRYQLPPLENLCSNISSALDRLSSLQEQGLQQSAPMSMDRQSEMTNLVELVGFACLCIQMETSSITAVNSVFENQTNISPDSLLHQPVDSISDMSLQLNLKEVMEKVVQNPAEIHTDSIEFNGSSFQVTAQGVYGSGQIAYILVAFIAESAETS